RVRNREICNFVVIFFPWLLSFSKPIHREHCKEISHCVLLRLILFFKNQSLLRSGFQRRSKSSFRGYLLMPDTDDSSSNQNQQVKSNAGSSHSSDNVEGAVKSLKLNENPCQNDGDVTKPGSYPERPGEPDCMYYLRKGVCGYGINCRYNHPKVHTLASQHRVELPERAGQPDCGYYLKTGTCKFGTTCKYHHPKDRNGAGPVSYNRLGLPIRNDEKPCSFYMRTGSCKFGGACKFHHPQPAATQPAATQPAATQPATTQPAATQPATTQPAATQSAATQPAATQPATTQPAATQPATTQPAATAAPPQGWNTYVANLNPRSSPPSIFRPNLVFNTGNQGDQGMFMPRYNIPRRVDQPVCRYFMNTGTCRYGSDCKYHHPEESRTSQPLINAAPPGLPSQPGQALCPSYATFGICKFGSSCRFDHPFIGYPYSYNLAVPPCSLPELAASMVTCYRNPFYFPSDQMNNAGIMKKTTTTTSSTTTKSEETVDTSDSSFEVLT
ncbi:Zinc finger CCCH domain-containing protein 3, partial [Linum perenne]